MAALRRAGIVLIVAVVACGTGMAYAISAAGATSVPGSAPTIAGDRAQESAIEAQVASDSEWIDHLSYQYDEAQQQLQVTDQALRAASANLAVDVADENRTLLELRREALLAYTTGGNLAGFDALFDFSPRRSMERTEYLRIATARISATLSAFHAARVAVAHQQVVLAGEKSTEQATLANLSSTRQQASAAVAREDALLSQVKGNLQQLLQAAHAEEVAAERAAAERAAAAQAAQLAAERAAASAAASRPGAGASSGGSGTSSPVLAGPPPPGWAGQAAIAVKTALAQVGKPYQWGGAGPNSFDCSGLVMYAWAAAGVSLPHFSVSQYDDTTHVSAAQLQPGDIVFYNSPFDGPLGHEALYIGNGQVVQAPMTGLNVMVTSMDWAGPPVAYGEPA